MFYALDIIGTLAFAISGALTAINKKLDLFGVLTIAFVTAVGGGTLRDVLTGSTPVAWMLSLNHVYIILLGFVLSALFWRKLEKLRVSLFLFDTIGLGVFTMIGIEKAVTAGLHPVICIALGTMTACFGGVLRDILCNEIPVLFRKEVLYATVCILGGIVFFALKRTGLNPDVIAGASSAIIIIVRLLAVRYKWRLPVLKQPL